MRDYEALIKLITDLEVNQKKLETELHLLKELVISVSDHLNSLDLVVDLMKSREAKT